MKTRRAFGGIVGDVEHDQLADSSQQDRIGADPIVATVHEVARLRKLAGGVAKPCDANPPNRGADRVQRLARGGARLPGPRHRAAPMTRGRPAPPEPAAVGAFMDAVRDLSEDPRPANVERYLTASVALEESRIVRAKPRRGRRRPARTRTAVEPSSQAAA